MQPAGLQRVFPPGWGQVQLLVTRGHGGSQPAPLTTASVAASQL